MKIETGKRIRIKVELKVADGDVIEQSAVEYFQGSGTMLPGLEAELEGLEPGAAVEGVIPAARAFGAPEHQHEKPIPRGELPEDIDLEKGSVFVAKAQGGQDVVLEVQRVENDTVVTVMKHPLADKDIAYKVEVLSVTDPTPPPLPAEAVGAEDGGED